MDDRMVDQSIHEDESSFELSLRPTKLRQYIGQSTIKSNLEVFIKAAKIRQEPLDHVLLFGPPGLGKTTLSNIIANEMEVNIRTISGPSVERPGDLAAILSGLQPGDVLFIDEIHRLSSVVEEVLYSAMEDFFLDIVIGKGEEARSIRIDLPPFTLIGATTRAGSLTAPLRDRFGVHLRLEYYKEHELKEIILRTTEVLGTSIDDDSAIELAKRSRGTPRVANRLLKRVRDFQQVKEDDLIHIDTTKQSLQLLQVDDEGLDYIDHKMMNCIINQYKGGPVGLDTIAVSIGEERVTIEDVYEPFLIQKGFIERTPRGRKATAYAFEHFSKNEKRE
ncbi:Holliday junction branch migration DNA helicase RuvB [Staphylococcus succinus]|jgi:Holliday junction DNA helicase RuvB|uniref:Holliday junction branch migration complex subunit RuvB n=1 Tax=Staphylococcus succinus TaxID=61015 RepID=A0A9Q6HMX0_9STAP|nr:Holliday junction branch migration DNA helicase RuvB [Staphylococcus succinus]MEB8126752.1 Holliday junction branch migration DNA helicase RuvB [Staphylococcus succinus]MEB8209190.1 Holliday junction branch migration DNA helicase RuvB [Staphylococcus succinus]PTI42150.1 Holliday junction branch migration DNA helicase RuvB [Staphylococcus succinus]PTI74411.1 Holliday junction branch migration DNA helicase RuvB [Staphylococcus succinus]PTJ17949.1 Holliday junction branch migration DNA helicas